MIIHNKIELPKLTTSLNGPLKVRPIVVHLEIYIYLLVEHYLYVCYNALIWILLVRNLSGVGCVSVGLNPQPPSGQLQGPGDQL